MKRTLKILNVIIIFCSFFSSKNAIAQLGFCNGNSGDPIFTETYGTGIGSNMLPAGTTTYSYQNGFPNDGFYTVRNGSFGNAFDWHQTEDHTVGDTNGKFLMVNASSNAGEFYRTTVSGLCESTTYEFSAWLLNLVIANSFCSTTPGGTTPIDVTFQITDLSGVEIISGNTGNITEWSSPIWQQFGLVFQTNPGETSVILKMINNVVNGTCGNDLAIDDIVFRTCGDNITVEDPMGNDNITICSSQTPYATTLTVTPDNSVFSTYFYQWETSPDGITWTDIPGETTPNITLANITASSFYRAKVAESAVNLGNTSCNVASDIFEVIVNQLPTTPTIACWETATVNTATCSWEVTGTQPTQPTGLDCWETVTFNNTTCVWDITGTQPIQPTIECWETATFNNTTCLWEVTGTQPVQPTGLDCWETATFNNATCVWEVTGTQPVQPTGLECWETTTFNNTTCVWDITGTQSTQPTTECWETATYNNTTCLWEVSGTQPAQPTGLNCWETATFNNTTCVWDVIGTQPMQPTTECWETATFNNTTCLWEVTGTQPAQPIGLECWETASFNNTTCLWEVSGTQPLQPTGLECWETTTFNSITCVWDIIGTQPVQPTTECWETATFNNTTCMWEVSGVQPTQPIIECWETATFNDTSCMWEITGSQPIDTIEEFETFCEGETISLEANTTIVNPTYTWSTGEMTQSITVNMAGVYNVEVTDGCSTTVITFNTTQIDAPIIETITSVGNTIVVTTTNTGDYLYSLDGNTYQTSNIFNNVEGGFYTIFVKSNSCNTIATGTFLQFIIPQFFTPNGDTENDTFDLKGIERFNSSEVNVFDRFGKLLISTKNAPFSWDGTFNNNPLPASDYWYVIIIDGQRRVGHFTLKR